MNLGSYTKQEEESIVFCNVNFFPSAFWNSLQPNRPNFILHSFTATYRHPRPSRNTAQLQFCACIYPMCFVTFSSAAYSLLSYSNPVAFSALCHTTKPKRQLRHHRHFHSLKDTVLEKKSVLQKFFKKLQIPVHIICVGGYEQTHRCLITKWASFLTYLILTLTSRRSWSLQIFVPHNLCHMSHQHTHDPVLLEQRSRASHTFSANTSCKRQQFPVLTLKV